MQSSFTAAKRLLTVTQMQLKHQINCRSRIGDPCDCEFMQNAAAVMFPEVSSSGLEKPLSPVGQFKATAAEVQAYREEHQCSLFTAKRNLLARNLSDAIKAAKSVDELKPALLAMLKLTDLQA